MDHNKGVRMPVNHAAQLHANSVSGAPPVRLSRRLLRYVVMGHELVPGARVLEIGCGAGELTGYLHRLSMEVTAYERNTDALKAAIKALPDVEIRVWKDDYQHLGDDGQYDLVIANGGEVLAGDLFSESALRWTAQLAGCLRSGGSLMYLVRHDPEQLENPVGHLTSCYTRLFSRFPGTITSFMVPDSFSDRRTWDWLLGRRPRSGYLAVSLHLPQRLMTSFEWHQWLAQEIARPKEPCCRWARRERPNRPPIRRAA